MKKVILVMAVFAMFASCKKKSEEIVIDEKLSPDIELVVKGAMEETLPLHQPSETYNFLGFGYDATDKFNNEVSIRASVVDITAYVANESSRINILRGGEGSWETIQAENAVDLSERFSNSFEHTKGLRLFGNTIEKTFPGTIVTDKKYVYGYYYNYWIRKRYKFYYEQSINNFLTADFKKDITLLNAQELVHKYGTNVLTGIKMGSKFDVVYQAEAKEGNKASIIMEGLRYAMKRTFGLSTGYLDDVNLRNLNANSSAQIYFNSIGGDMSKLEIETINNRQVVNITNWLSTNTEANARFIGAYDNGLIPLDRFIDDSVKKAEVKSYLEQYFAAKEVKLTN
ncbi:MAC/perforin domain-containing protein [Pedobacter sp. B4-66]|uniref:MAC/perforin domain-containing protein n=1 Tax=Pedobacter sp. B4-66 TaxID=2817280 RepID=UPI001BD9D7D7|nr:MAC/perforin domain-containing protein [Pedobacter sp. B4-66]